MAHNLHIAKLIARLNQGTITTEEKAGLEKWIRESARNEAIYNKATDAEHLLKNAEIYELFDDKKAWKIVEKEVFNTPVISLFSNKIVRYAAALIPLFVAFSLSWYFLGKNDPNNLTVLDQSAKPGSDKAFLVLGDGTKINLSDSTPNDSILQGNTTALLSENAGITYLTEEDDLQTPIIYNELITPKGGKFNLTLSDGTKIWLNAGSSLKFPVQFTESTRTVYLSGEAFFDVKHNAIPFIVETEAGNIGVLGTVFNISAYPDDEIMKTTLAEGSVKITTGAENEVMHKILEPDEQALVAKKTNSISVKKVNSSYYTSWVNNKLEFNNESLENVMKRLARWYEFNYVFKNKKALNYHFTARFENKQHISSILEMLEMTTDVKFEIEMNTVIIK